MKTAKDPRHRQRVFTVKELFSWEFNPQKKTISSLSKQTKAVLQHLEQIDQEITSAAPEWPLNQINRIDLAILRLAVFELLIIPTLRKKEFLAVPYKVIADEAVELAKEFGADSSPSFINGVLGQLITSHQIT